MILYVRVLIECVTSRKISSAVAVGGEGDVAGEGRVVGAPKFIPGVTVPCHY